jgi:nucleoside 2-deoxyribosyltransferase
VIGTEGGSGPRPRVYLAGPEVFLARSVALSVGQAKKDLCAAFGFVGVFPLDEAADLSALSPNEQGLAIFDHSIALLDSAQVVVANMTPFRGVSMDVGTAIEVGYFYGLGRPVFGYTNDGVDYKARVGALSAVTEGTDVEDFGFVDNLMCEGPARRSGVPVVRGTASSEHALTDLRAFEECLRQAARVLDTA